MSIFFTSDTHFHHERVIEYGGRPFQNASDMEQQLIANWNAVVRANDRVYHLGDFSFGSPEKWLSVLSRLNGRIVLVRGNHDAKAVKSPQVRERFEFVADYLEEKIDGHFVVMQHYALVEWNRAHYGSFMLHGHHHGALEAQNASIRRMDVGMDAFFKGRYAPVSWDEVRTELNKRPALKGTKE